MFWLVVNLTKQSNTPYNMEQEEAQNLMNSYTNLADGTSSTKVELSVDEVIDEYIGSFGFSQLLHVFLVSLAWMFDAQTTLVTIFTDAQPASWMCKPGSVSCDASSGGGSVCGLEPGTWEWVGGATTSVIAEWDLVCDRKFLAAIPASLFFICSLLGSAIYGHLADAWLGRKRTMLVACVLTSATSYFTSLAPNIWIYTFLRFANGFVRSGIGICCLVLSTEAVGHRWRGQVGQYGFFFFTAGFLSLPFIAYPTRACWRNLYKIISLFPILYIILLVPFVSESPLWLLVRERTEEALCVLKDFARLNGKKLPSNLSLSNLSPPKISGASEGENREAITVGVDEGLWRTEWAAKRIITVMLAGFGVGFVYYGIQLNVENLSFDLYSTAALNAMMEIPAVFIGSVLLGFMDRRRLFSLSAYAAGISCILCIVFSHQDIEILSKSIGSWVQLLIEALGFMAASTAFNVMYIYCVELFPTNVRNYAVSLLRQALMLGASIAPSLVAVGRLSPWLSFVIFGALFIFSGLLNFWLPETRNSPLYDTLKQQEEEERLNGHSEDFQGRQL